MPIITKRYLKNKSDINNWRYGFIWKEFNVKFLLENFHLKKSLYFQEMSLSNLKWKKNSLNIKKS